MPHRTPASSSRAALPNSGSSGSGSSGSGSSGQRLISKVPATLSLALTMAAAAVFSQAPGANAALLVASADARQSVRPAVTLQAPVVEDGHLTLHWTETGGPSDHLDRTVRIEAAPATPADCGTFQTTGGVALGRGTYETGEVSLGSPPSSGCVRATLALTDPGGATTVTTSPPYRVAPLPPAKPKPAATAWTGKFNLFRKNAFVTQKTFKWCVAASVQMMVNIVRKRADRSTATQRRMILYAQRWDNGSYGEAGGAEDGGTDVTGWIRALRHFGAGKYREVGAETPAKALQIAAIAMRQTGRPAGILVMEGRHAWVLHGFESKRDPKKDRRARVTAVRVSGPLYPLQQKNGYDPRPNTRMTVKKLENFFQPTVIGDMPGRYVVVVPTH